MIIKTLIKIAIICFTLLLSACDLLMNDNIDNICTNSPEICNDINKISHCRFKRTEVIRARYYDKINPSNIHKTNLLTELNEYESCLERTLFLQPVRNKERQNLRVENYLRTQQLIKEHLALSKGTKDPILAYYLWTRYQDKHARSVFFNEAMKDNVKNPQLLFKLATTYSKDNPQKSLDLFYKALRLTKSLEQTTPLTFVMIMTIFYQKKSFEEAYIWALVAKELDENDEYPINLELILQKGDPYGEQLIFNEEKLNDKADQYYDQLDDGKFKAKAPNL